MSGGEEQYPEIPQSPQQQAIDDLKNNASSLSTNIEWDGQIGNTPCPFSHAMDVVERIHCQAKAEIAQKLKVALATIPKVADGEKLRNDIRQEYVETYNPDRLPSADDPHPETLHKEKILYSFSAPNSLPVKSDLSDLSRETPSKINYAKDAEYARVLALHQVAEAVKSSFIDDMKTIAGSTGCFSAGTEEDGYQWAVKGEGSAQRKVEARIEDRAEIVNQDSEIESYVAEMGDMLRGTIVVEIIQVCKRL
ncbi:MAG: hypothetical protein LBB25_02790 [Holosporaceae bacterium]|nr:hypothetical protein [Holosporaceae bacterium]